jgi:DNA-binding transcriptional ArsR family regulator
MRGPGFQKERGERQMKRILDALQDGPLTVRQLSDRLHMAGSGIFLYLRKLREEPRRVRIAGFVRTQGIPATLYGLGTEPDARYKRPRKVRKERAGSGQRTRILELVADYPLSTQQLVGRLGIAASGIRVYLRGLRADNKIHIADWRRSEGNPVPLYAKGNKADAPMPPRLPRQNYRAKAKVRATRWAAALFSAAP